MITIDALKAFGANTQEGLNRCFNQEAFYLKLVGMGLADPNFDRLQTAVAAGDARAAFEAAHALKGSIGNLALTPLYDPICELTEKLRAQDQVGDVGGLVELIMSRLAELRALND